MAWSSSKLSSLIDQAKKEISRFYPKVVLNATVLISTEHQLVDALIQEKISENAPDKEIIRIKTLRSFFDGMYFKDKNEIWLIQKRGEKLGTLINEFLHSIQLCSPNRERIVEYLTYKLTGDSNELLTARLDEWTEIEKSLGLKKILSQLVKLKDCEDF